MKQVAMEEYARALKRGQREIRELAAEGLRQHPLVLDEILPENYPGVVVDTYRRGFSSYMLPQGKLPLSSGKVRYF